MTNMRIQITLGVLACLCRAAHGASINPFDPSLPPGIHAFATCNFIPNQAGSNSASCTDAQVAQNPATLTQVLGVNESAADLHAGTLRSSSNAQAYRFGADNLHANAGGFAQFYDTITFSGGFTGQVELRMIISGSMLAPAAGSPISGRSVASLFGFTDAGVERGSASIWIDQFTSGGAFISNQFSFGLPADIDTNANALGNFDPGNVQATLDVLRRDRGRSFFHVRCEAGHVRRPRPVHRYRGPTANQRRGLR